VERCITGGSVDIIKVNSNLGQYFQAQKKGYGKGIIIPNYF
jgi:hypothetical protein